jgi:predicted metal-dependent phosphoesterase TrpH
MPGADLHLHTNFSDGRQSPREMLAHAAQAGLDLVAICDHDNTGAYPEAINTASEFGLRLLQGIELTVVEANQEVHVLGYGFNPEHPAILAHAETARVEREIRIQEVLKLLANKHAIHISFEELCRQYRFVERSAVAREISLQRGIPVGDAANEYLRRGCSAYVRPWALDPAPPNARDAIDRLHAAGGLAVLAHPFDPYLPPRTDEDIEHLLDKGFDGIEAWHSRHTEEQTGRLRLLAQRRNLLVSAGSDCHGIPEKLKTGYVRLSPDEPSFHRFLSLSY